MPVAETTSRIGCLHMRNENRDNQRLRQRQRSKANNRWDWELGYN